MVDVYIGNAINEVRALYAATLARSPEITTIAGILDFQACMLLDAHSVGDETVVFQLTCWCNELKGKKAAEILDHKLTSDMANQTIASEHGFANWSAVKALNTTELDATFETCVDAVLFGEIDKLNTILSASAALTTQRSQYGHQATLLHYLAANGVETYRQVTPTNAAQIAQCLIEHGADVNAIANIYGGSKPLELLTTSAHPANAGVTDEVAAVLIKAGAS